MLHTILQSMNIEFGDLLFEFRICLEIRNWRLEFNHENSFTRSESAIKHNT